MVATVRETEMKDLIDLLSKEDPNAEVLIRANAHLHAPIDPQLAHLPSGRGRNRAETLDCTSTA